MNTVNNSNALETDKETQMTEDFIIHSVQTQTHSTQFSHSRT